MDDLQLNHVATIFLRIVGLLRLEVGSCYGGTSLNCMKTRKIARLRLSGCSSDAWFHNNLEESTPSVVDLLLLNSTDGRRTPMAEQYTEKARRALGFARDEAKALESPFIESDHLLLGLVCEIGWLAIRLPHATLMEEVRRETQSQEGIGRKIQHSANVPFSNEFRQVLVYAAEEADDLGHKYIGTEHLLLGLLRETGSRSARLLNRSGVTLEAVRAQMEEATNASNH